MHTKKNPALLVSIVARRPMAKSLSASLAILVALAISAAAHANGLVFWNRLGSDSEILDSAAGPNLEFYGGGDAFSVPAVPAYVPGVFGGALTIGPGSYSSTDRVHNAVLNGADQLLSAERGTVEAWYRQNADPVPYQNGIYRIFDGGFGLGSGLGLESQPGGLRFNVAFGGTFIEVLHDVSALNNTWIHVAGVWDRAGIGGSADTMRLYVDGSVVASTTASNWGSAIGSRVDVAGANDNDIAGKFYVDNLKVYDFAVTNFSHRFDENWIVPEPAAAALAVLATLLLPSRRSQRQS